MNDSFLEDLELIPKETKKTNHNQQVDCHITTRHTTSSPLLYFSEQNEKDSVVQEKRPIAIQNISSMKITDNKNPSSKNCKKHAGQNIRKPLKSSEKNEKIVENKVKIDNKQQGISGISQTKLHETRLKTSKSKTLNTELNEPSGAYKKNSHSLNISTIENKCSPDCSEKSSYDLDEQGDKLSGNLRKPDFIMHDKDPIAPLTAVEELISTYTKQESTKILRAMQELHINSQATLIKNLLDQTDDLRKEMHPERCCIGQKRLVEENMELHQKLLTLQVQNDNYRKKLEELEFLKEENACLKSRYGLS